MAKARVNWGPTDDGAQVSVFGIYNTSHRCLYVLACDAKEAMEIACAANHIYGNTPITALDYSRHAFEAHELPAAFKPFADSVAAARSNRFRGTLEVEGDKLILGTQVIS